MSRRTLMRKSQFKEEQITSILKQSEAGAKAALQVRKRRRRQKRYVATVRVIEPAKRPDYRWAMGRQEHECNGCSCKGRGACTETQRSAQAEQLGLRRSGSQELAGLIREHRSFLSAHCSTSLIEYLSACVIRSPAATIRYCRYRKEAGMKFATFVLKITLLAITLPDPARGDVPAVVRELDSYSRLFLYGQVRADAPNDIRFLETSPEQRVYLRYELPETPPGTFLSKATLFIDGGCVVDCGLPFVSGISDLNWDILTLMAQFAPEPDLPIVTGVVQETAEAWDVTSIVQPMIDEGGLILVLSPQVIDPPSASEYYTFSFEYRHTEPWLVLEYTEDAVKGVVSLSWGAVKAQY